MANRKIIVLISLLISTLGIAVTLTLTTLQPPSELMPTLARIDQYVSQTEQAQTMSDALSSLPIGDELMIQLVGDSTNDALESVLTSLGADVVQEIPNMNAAVIVKTQPITSQQIADLPANVIVEPNYKVQSLLTYPSNDPMINDQWSFATMDVTTLWESVETNETIVAVIDSGVCFDHPDLQGRFVDGGYDYVDDDTTPTDEMGHGCAVSGIIAANANNGIGIAGIAPNTKILPLRVLDADGVGTYADVISAIYQAVSSGADIINLSLGGQNHSQLLEQAVNDAVANGVQVVAGAGNTGTEGVFYPAKYPNVIAVGSYGIDGKRSSFSTYGNEVDTLAPGENILTTTKNGNYAYFTGTSMAVPYVTGLLALSNASGQPVDLANILDTPAPEDDGEVYALATDTRPAPSLTPSSIPSNSFSCDNISANFRIVPFNGSRVFIEITNSNTQLAYLLETDVHWDKSAVQADFPNINFRSMSLETEVYWVGEDDISPTNSSSEGTLLYDPDNRTHNIYAPADSEIALWQGQLLNGPTSLFDYFDTSDFAGTSFLFDNPVSDNDCLIEVESNPIPAPVDCTNYLNTYILGTVQSDLVSDLRQAMVCANESSADNTIDLNSQTVILNDAPAAYDLEGYNGLPSISSTSVAGKLTIQNGTIMRDNSLVACDVAVETNRDAFRFFFVTDSAEFTLMDVTIQNGCAHDVHAAVYNDEYGGAIYNTGNLSIFESTLDANKATDSGGAIYNTEAGDLITDFSSFTNNESDRLGGAIYSDSDGSAGVQDTDFIGNASQYGGAITSRFSSLLVQNAEFTSNTAGHGAAVNSAFGETTIINSIFTHNDVTQAGGAIAFSSETAHVEDSVFSLNSAPDFVGGAILAEGEGTLTLQNSTLYNNDAETGGGLYVGGPTMDVTITNSTFVENIANYGGGINIVSGIVTIYNSTLSGNIANNFGAGIYHISNSPDLHIANTIIANSQGADCASISGSIYWGMNLVEDGSCQASLFGQLTGDPMLDPAGLQDNGGLTQTIALMAGSPAIDAGDNSQIPVEVTTDQRGVGYPRIADSTVDLGAYETISDIICESYNTALLTGYIVGTVNSNPEADFRQAIECANESTSDDVIDLNGITITYNDAPVAYDAAGYNALQPITSTSIGGTLIIQNGTIERDSNLVCDKITDSRNEFRFFYLENNANLTLSNLTLHNGCAARSTDNGTGIDTYGGAIYSTGILSLNNSTLSDNVADGDDSQSLYGIGGAIYGQSGSITLINTILSGNIADTGGAIYAGTQSVVDVTITHSTIENNQASFAGGVYLGTSSLFVTNSTFNDNSSEFSGGIHTELADDVKIINSTFHNNSATSQAGAVYIYATQAMIANSSFSSNPSGTAESLFVLNTPLTLVNSIIADNVNGTLCSSNAPGLVTYVGMNLVEDGSCDAATNGQLTGDPMLDPTGLQDNGGSTQTIALMAGSPAIDAGDNAQIPAEVTTDQRGEGYPRIADSTVDLGAYETISDIICESYNPALLTSYLVGTVNNNSEADLRQAIECANASSVDNIIDLDGQIVTYVDAPLAFQNDGNNALPSIVDKSVAGKLLIKNGTIERDIDLGCYGDTNELPEFRLLHVSSGADLTISEMTLQHGCATDVTVMGGDQNGGAIHNEGTTTILNSTLAYNKAQGEGGAIRSSLGQLNIINSTLIYNVAAGAGGGIHNTVYSDATVINSTIVDNIGFGSGGIYNHFNATFNLHNSIVANNAGGDCALFTGLSYHGINFIGDDSCNAALYGQLTGDPMLDPAGLQDNGGATRTIALLAGSPAIDAGDNSQIPVEVTTDQRGTGYPRIQGSTVDLGAYEANSDIICESYNTALLTGYSVGTVNSDLQADLRQAIECANVLPSNDVIDLNGATITFIDAPGTYDKMGHNALQPITSTSVAGSLTIQNGTIERDESLACDAIADSTHAFRFFYIEEDAEVTLTNLTLDNGCASESPQNPPGYEEIKMFGGAIYNNGQLQINGSTLSNNLAQSDYEANEWGLGGAIYNVSGTVTLVDSVLSDNIADIGAGIFSGLVASGDIIVTNTTVSRNLATYGGGIMIIWGNLYVTDSTFDANQASTSNGGAISASGSELVVSNSVFHDNHAGQNGGAIDAYPNILTINSSLFYNNSSNYAGGAIVSAPGISGTIVNTTVTYNTANLEGGGISVANDNHVINSTIAQNSAPRGTEIHGYFKPLVLTNSIIANSSGTSQCGSLLGEVNYEGLNLIQDGSCDAEANGQLTGDPLLGPLQNNGGQSQTMALLAGSPAINVGDNTLIPAGINFDQRGAGYARVQGPAVDLGAFESSLLISCANHSSPYTLGTYSTDLEADLRQAIACANESSENNIIDLNGLTAVLDDAPVEYDVRGYNGLPPLLDKSTSGSLTLQNGTITRDMSLTCDSDLGDRTEFRLLMLMPNSDLTLTNVTVSNGCASNVDTSIIYANDGAGIYNQAGTLTVNRSALRDNTTVGVRNYGAGIYSDGGLVNISGTHFIANASDDNGTGIAIELRNTVASISHSLFSDNIGTTQSHNAVFVGNSMLEISNSIFKNNKSGAISTHDSTLIVENSTFSHNQYQVVANYDSILTINNSIFSNNTGLNGGSIVNWGETANAEISNSTFNANNYTRGAAIYNTVYATMVIQNTTISNNVAELIGGGIYNSNLATLSVINSTISDNSAGDEGGGIYNRTDLTLSNTIVANSPSGNDCQNVSPGHVNYIGMNLIGDGSCGASSQGQLSGDPLLGTLQDNGGSTETMALLAGSPSIDAGNNAFASGLIYDQRGVGYPRIYGTSVDLGAYEYQPTGPTPTPSPTPTFTPTATYTPTIAPLLPISSISATFINETTSQMTWSDDNVDESGYRIMRQVSDTWSEIDVVAPNVTTYLDATIDCHADFTYDYQIQAYRDFDGNTAYSDIVSIWTGDCPFYPASELVANAISDEQVNLTWSDNSGLESNYVVERKTASQNWIQIANLSANSMAFSNNDLECERQYQYRVRGYQALFDRHTDPVTTIVTTGQCTVEAPFVTSTIMTSSQISMEWNPIPPQQTTHIMVERAEHETEAIANLDWQVKATVGGGATIFTDHDIHCGMTYSYRLQGYNDRHDEYTGYTDTIQFETDECPTAVSNTIGLYHSGRWVFRQGFENNSPETTFRFGPQEEGWTPLTGDWDGDGADGIGIYKDGVFALRDISDAGAVDYVYRFGSTQFDWQPITGDWNGDGIDTVGLYHDGRFILTDSNTHPTMDYQFTFGKIESGWQPIAGDWFSHGRDYVGVYKDGVFLLHDNFGNRSSGTVVRFGSGDGWIPIAGDWDADGFTTIGLYKDSNWRLSNTNQRTVDIGFRFNYFNGQGFPLASYRGDDEALEALALFAVGEDINVNALSQPQEATPTLEPTDVSVTISATEVEISPTMMPVSDTEDVMITITTTVESTLESTPEPSLTPTMTMIPTLTATWTPTPTMVPPSATAVPTVEPTATEQAVKQEPKPEATDEVSGG